jgi:hypothetical protein
MSMATPLKPLSGAPLSPNIRLSQPLSLEKMQRLAAGDEAAELYVLDLLTSLQAADEEIRAGAADALQTIEHLPSEWASVSEYCTHTNPVVAAAACRLVSKLGEQATRFQAAVVGCLTQHPEISARQQAALWLGSLPQLSSESRMALERAALSEDPRLKRLAQAALSKCSVE